ncbi:hypothetical protein CALVIDRAFT_188625 [Calocera viscosa TUFC12733]|uniref:Uncharacterized protein n=1 Tax=Calocera viscosa (strain TUFC12733) TaxID=1330018 RepID=A0A167KVY0_CALVF|nr:hypothetical protein CALVIDRAFT_188625 [Calocera viscosa TUFC12733]
MLRVASRNWHAACRHCLGLLRPSFPSTSVCTRARLLHTTPSYAYPRAPRNFFPAGQMFWEDDTDIPIIQMDEAGWERVAQAVGLGQQSASWLLHLAGNEQIEDETLMEFLRGLTSYESDGPQLPPRETVYRLFCLLPKIERNPQLTRRLLSLAFAGGSEPDSVPQAGFRLLQERSLNLTRAEFDEIYHSLFKMEYWPVLFVEASRAAAHWRALNADAPHHNPRTSSDHFSNQELHERERERQRQMKSLQKECMDALHLGWEKGVALCASFAGELYASGRVVHRSGKAARMWWERAANSGYIPAMKHLGRHLGLLRNPSKRRLMPLDVPLAIRYNTQAALWSGAAAYQAAQYFFRPLGSTKEQHRARWGVDPDDTEAGKWFFHGVRKGHLYCRLGLARLLLEKRTTMAHMRAWEKERRDIFSSDDEALVMDDWDDPETDEDNPSGSDELDPYELQAAGVRRATHFWETVEEDGRIMKQRYEVFIGSLDNPDDVEYAKKLQRRARYLQRKGGDELMRVEVNKMNDGDVGYDDQAGALLMDDEFDEPVKEAETSLSGEQEETFTDGFDIPMHLLSDKPHTAHPRAPLDETITSEDAPSAIFKKTFTPEEKQADARERVEEWMRQLECVGALIDGVPISDPRDGIGTRSGAKKSFMGRKDLAQEVQSLYTQLERQKDQARTLLTDDAALRGWRKAREKSERREVRRAAGEVVGMKNRKDPMLKWQPPAQEVRDTSPIRSEIEQSHIQTLFEVLGQNPSEAEPELKTQSKGGGGEKWVKKPEKGARTKWADQEDIFASVMGLSPSSGARSERSR